MSNESYNSRDTNLKVTAIIGACIFGGDLILFAVVIGVGLYQVINVHSYNGMLVTFSTGAFILLITISLIFLLSAFSILLTDDSTDKASAAKACQLVKNSFRITIAASVAYAFVLMYMLF